MRRALVLAALALAAAPAGAQAATRVVDMPGKFFVPPTLSVLTGDTVTWANSDSFDHDVAALDGSFDSGRMSTGARYSVTFPAPGRVAYRCTLHPFMAGSVEVFAFELLGPHRAVAAGSPAILHGLVPPGTGAVRVEQRRPDGSWVQVAVVVPKPDGSFSARVVPRGPAVYRAIADAGPSAPLALPVGARLDTTVRRLRGGRFAVRATTRPAQPGTPAALQLYSRERFRWRQVAHARVDRRSRVSFVVSPPGRYAARIVLLRGRGGYGASVGPTRHIGGRGTPRRARPAPRPEHHHHRD
ncbi:MAG TPA: plastocyanin/azurin family copper-binding protein [Solirubrobacteraceae bacterium]|nr:plastocyanin/azurin family copper-binding protein [Solirubrobacteraceae bacterium]